MSKGIPWNKRKTNIYSKERLQKMSNITKGLWQNPEFRNRQIKSHLGIKLSKESIEKRTESRKGFKPTKRQKKKTSESLMYHIVTEETREKIRNGKKRENYRHSEETKKKIGLANKFTRKLSGEEHPRWQGGISFEPYGIGFGKALKKEIRKRENNKCFLCGKRKYKRELDVHHIDHNKKNHNIINLVALCTNCHRSAGFRRIYYEQILKDLIKEKYKLQIVV